MDNLVRDEGYGHWFIQTYQPEGGECLGPFNGTLLIDSKLYLVKANTNDTDSDMSGTTIAVVPSQNVANVINGNLFTSK